MKKKPKHRERQPVKKKSTMSAPMCKLCHTRHWSNAPHHFAPKSREL